MVNRSLARRFVRGLAPLLALGLILAACGGEDSDPAASDDDTEAGDDNADDEPADDAEDEPADDADDEPADDGGDGLTPGDGQEIAMFVMTSSNIYGENQINGAIAQAEELGYELVVFEHEFSQPEQDEQVRQYIASGAEPAAIIFWPWVAEAAVNSVRQLSEVAPVIQITQEPNEDIEPFVVAYSGANQQLIGRTVGDMLLQAREAARESGAELNNPDGNLFIFQHPEGELTGSERLIGVEEVTADEPFNRIGLEFGANSPETGFEIGSQVVPRIRDEVDFLWVSNQQAANGVIRALKDNDLTPGEDVWIVSGDCSGTIEAVENGETFGTGIQPAAVEGRLAVRTAHRYIVNGTTEGDVEQLEVVADIPPVDESPSAFRTFMPHAPAVGAEGVAETQIWGQTAEEICAG